jgi:uncharacterized protein (DUF58 family)
MEAPEERTTSLFTTSLILLAVGIFLFIALVYGQRGLTVWAILVFGVVGGAKVWGRLSLSGIRCHSTIDKERVFPGERFTLKVSMENAKFLPVWLQVTLRSDSLVRPSSDETGFTRESGLWWHQRVGFLWKLTAQRRGVHPVGPPLIMAGDLLGFFPEEREEPPLDIIVYPRLVPLKPFPSPRRDFFGIPGRKSPIKDPIYILGTRDYQHGQPARYIHWKASARYGRLQEKVFDPSEQEKVLLVVDVDRFSKNKAEEKFEQALEIVASLAIQLEQKRCAIGLVTNGAITGGRSPIVPIARNPQQLPGILEVLARLRMEPGRDLKGIIERGSSVLWGVSCILFALEADETALAAGEYFARRRIPTVFVVAHSPSTPEGYRQRFKGKIYCFNDICS